MEVFRSLAEFAGFGPTVVSIGNFDGVHRGHRWVIERVKARAEQLGLRSIVLTFDPHPARVLRPDCGVQLITPLDQKLELLAATGIDAALVLPFTAELSQLTPTDFARTVLHDALHAREVHEGETFRFGYQAAADMHGLHELGRSLGFAAHSYAPLVLRGEAVSSSRIRGVLAAGDVSQARALLGRPFAIRSTPASGRGYGTRYTVPTINLAAYAELVPANGVYVTTLTVGRGAESVCFEGVTNVGHRPTFGADSFAIESHLLNFAPIALEEQTPLELAFLNRIRDEQRFESPALLLAQIKRDVKHAQRFFALAGRSSRG